MVPSGARKFEIFRIIPYDKWHLVGLVAQIGLMALVSLVALVGLMALVCLVVLVALVGWPSHTS